LRDAVEPARQHVEGVAVQLLLERAGVRPDAQYCLVSAEQGFTTNLPLTDLDRPDNLVAFRWNGEWLMPEHGGPARLLVPHLYFWKSAKWVRGFTLVDQDVPGFWEQNGYHMRGDPGRKSGMGDEGLRNTISTGCGVSARSASSGGLNAPASPAPGAGGARRHTP